MLIRSLIFTTLFFLLTLLLSVAVLLLAPFGFGARFQVGVVWARVNLWLLERICGLGYAVEGRENIPAESGIAMIKHSSTFETIVVFLLFPPQCIVLKRELMWIPFLGWALALIKPIAIDRKSGRRAVPARSGNRLRPYFGCPQRAGCRLRPPHAGSSGQRHVHLRTDPFCSGPGKHLG